MNKIDKYKNILVNDVDSLINELKQTPSGNGWYQLMKHDLAEYLVMTNNEERVYVSSNNHQIPTSDNLDFKFKRKFSREGELIAGWRQSSKNEASRKRILNGFNEAFHVQADTNNIDILLDVKNYLETNGPGQEVLLTSETKDIFEYVDEKQKEIMFRAELPLILNGFAGTGKTVILQQLALRSISEGESKALFLSQNDDVIETAQNFFADNGIKSQVECFAFEGIDTLVVDYEMSNIKEFVPMGTDAERNKYLNKNLFSLDKETEDNMEKLIDLHPTEFMSTYFKTRDFDFKAYTALYVDEAPLMADYAFFEKITKIQEFCLAYDTNQHNPLNIEQVRNHFVTDNIDSINVVHRTTKQIFELAAQQINLDTSDTEFANDNPASVITNADPGENKVFPLSEIETFIDSIIGWESEVVNVFADVMPQDITNKNYLYILFTRAKFVLNVFGPYAEEYTNV